MIEIDEAGVTLVAEGLRFPEGPVVLANGDVLVVEIEGHTVARVSPDGTAVRYPVAPGPNGMAIGPDSAAYVCTDGGLKFDENDGIRFPIAMADDWAGGRIQRLDLASGAATTLFEEVEGNKIISLNDIVFDATGSCYVVDTAMGLLYYADPLAGTIAVVERDIQAPNGMGLSPDGKTLYVSETFSGNLLRWDVTAPGVLANRVQHWSSGGEHGFDGLSIDGQGNVCVASLAASGVTVISPEGEKIGFCKLPLYDSFVTNIAFGGPDMRTAYICSSGRGRLYSVQWPWPGLKLHYNA